jgi:cytochrome c
MKTLVAALAVAGIAAFAAAPASAQSAADLLKKHACLSCHAVDKKLVGPSYKDVAAKYRGQKDVEATLAGKIKKGGQGVWGQIPMPPNPNVSDADMKVLVGYILSVK